MNPKIFIVTLCVLLSACATSVPVSPERVQNREAVKSDLIFADPKNFLCGYFGIKKTCAQLPDDYEDNMSAEVVKEFIRFYNKTYNTTFNAMRDVKIERITLLSFPIMIAWVHRYEISGVLLEIPREHANVTVKEKIIEQ